VRLVVVSFFSFHVEPVSVFLFFSVNIALLAHDCCNRLTAPDGSLKLPSVVCIFVHPLAAALVRRPCLAHFSAVGRFMFATIFHSVFCGTMLSILQRDFPSSVGPVFESAMPYHTKL
jgi:hypothetical protein